jgi:geranylgeranyl diphosphate synthase type I
MKIMSFKKHKKTSQLLLGILEKRSRKGLELAKKIVLTEKVESQKVYDALEYYTSNWKIFTHPGLFSIACEAVGGNPENAINVQASLAMITAALDIHDDILDKSKIKRGRLTVYGKFGHDIALLLGNAFIVSGFTLLGKSIAKLPVDKTKEVFDTVQKSLFKIGNAHALESALKGNMYIAPEQYMQILEMKAFSAEASMRLGAIIGGATDYEVEFLAKYGRILGLLATLREEFIDIFEIQELRQRISNECLPMPILYALQNENSKEILQKLLLKKKITDSDVDQLLNVVMETNEVKKLKRKMKSLVKAAIALASNIKHPKLKNLLDQLATAALEDL